jgi:hypothetical protein
MDGLRAHPALFLAGCLSAIAALLHLAVIFGGPDWYRFFGAGETMARMAERGSPRPIIITLVIATVLAVWALYAFSGAGVIGRLPLLRLGLVIISAIYLVRGIGVFVLMPWQPNMTNPFWIWSSLIVLVCGLTYAIGTWLAWADLGRSPIAQ